MRTAEEKKEEIATEESAFIVATLGIDSAVFIPRVLPPNAYRPSPGWELFRRVLQNKDVEYATKTHLDGGSAFRPGVWHLRLNQRQTGCAVSSSRIQQQRRMANYNGGWRAEQEVIMVELNSWKYILRVPIR